MKSRFLTSLKESKKILLVIVGPTAVGKTDLCLELAREFETEIISADSRQLFKEMQIGTAQPSVAEMQGIKHHFIASHSIHQNYNAGKYELEAMPLIDDLFKKKDIIILSGGSGLYINAVCNGFDELPQADEKTRKYLEEILKLEGIQGLQKLLKKLDPDYFQKIDVANPQRMMRALEITMITGKPYSDFRKEKTKNRNFKTIKIGLNRERPILYARINARVEMMMNKGLLKEAMDLYQFKNLNALQTVGYRELFDYLDNKTDLNTAINLIKQNSRRFAKRQITWFKSDPEIHWFNPEDKNDISTFIRKTIHPDQPGD